MLKFSRKYNWFLSQVFSRRFSSWNFSEYPTGVWVSAMYKSRVYRYRSKEFWDLKSYYRLQLTNIDGSHSYSHGQWHISHFSEENCWQFQWLLPEHYFINNIQWKGVSIAWSRYTLQQFLHLQKKHSVWIDSSTVEWILFQQRCRKKLF